MKNVKFYLSTLSLLLCLSFSAAAQEVSISGTSTSNACPDVLLSYKASATGFQSGSGTKTITYQWTAEDASLISNSDTDSPNLKWSNVSKKVKLKVVASQKDKDKDDVILVATKEIEIAINSLVDKSPELEAGGLEVLMPYCTNTVRVDFKQMVYPNNSPVSTYRYVLPAGWTSNWGVGAVNGNNSITLTLPNGCIEGTFTAMAASTEYCFAAPYHSKIVEIKVKRNTASFTLSFSPSNYVAKCDDLTPVTISAPSLACAEKYNWKFPVGWRVQGLTTPLPVAGNFSTTVPTITLVPDGRTTSINIEATAVLCNNTKTITTNRAIPFDNSVGSMTFTSFPRNGLCGDNNFILTATTPTTGNPVRYRWTIGNSRVLGSNTLVTSTPSLEVFSKSQNGSVTVSVVAENNCGGRSNPASVTFFVGRPEFTIIPIEFTKDPNTICANTYVTFFASVPPTTFGESSTYVWNRSPAMQLIWASGQTATYQMLTPNTAYTVAAAIQNSCGIGENAVVVYAAECSGGGSYVPMRLFPNPAENSLTLGFDENATKQSYSYQIMNELGIVLLSGENTAGNNQTIDLQNLSKGVYYVKIITQQGLSQKRLVIEK